MRAKLPLLTGWITLSLTAAALADGFFDNTDNVQGKMIDLGAAGRTHHYAVFSTNGDISATDTINEINIDGDVGANGNVSLSGAILHGDLYLKTGKTLSLSNKGQLTGKKFQNATYDASLNQGASDAATLSSNIGMLTGQNNGSYVDGSSINMTNTKFSITGGANQVVVLKLTDFVLTNSELDLMGTATTKFIINVTGTFSLSGASKVINGGALLASNVIFNYRPSSGSPFASIGGGSTFNGILVAANNATQLTGGSRVNGEIIAKSVLLSGGSKVGPTQPPVVSP